MTIHNGVLNNKTKAPEVLDELKKQRLYLRIKIRLVMEPVFIIYMYINAIANNVMLQLHL